MAGHLTRLNVENCYDYLTGVSYLAFVDIAEASVANALGWSIQPILYISDQSPMHFGWYVITIDASFPSLSRGKPLGLHSTMDLPICGISTIIHSMVRLYLWEYVLSAYQAAFTCAASSLE
jgi:hypothetical protein